MPIVSIEVTNSFTQEEEIALMRSDHIIEKNKTLNSKLHELIGPQFLENTNQPPIPYP